MESLIPVISKLQDVFATVGYREADVELPQIVVVGSQSSGKSSVIEGIVGRDFLPRGAGIVTRRPLLLHLIHVPLNSVNRQTAGDWAVFEHKNNEVFTDFELVRQEIEVETERTTGTNKGISALPINLKIYSHRVVNLSLIDLPGITKVPVGDQPADIEIQIRKMIVSFISNPNSLILAVTAANQDFATSEAMKLAREVDKEGNRTLAVLTKLDLMDHGTDALDVLTGKVVPVKLGILGVVNRSQADIKNKKTIQDCLKDEVKFLHKTYPTLASSNGIQYLSKTLNRLLIQHIRQCLPQLKMRISTMAVQCQNLLTTYGEPVTDKNKTLLQIITHFATAYTSTIEGTAKNIDTTELSGGARICYIFYETFGQALQKVDPMDCLSPVEVLTAIRNATGPRPALFVSEVSFELLVKRQIRRLEDPSLTCVDLVYEELLRIVQHCGFEIQQEMQRFPRLYERINEVVSTVLVARLSPTKEFVSNLVGVELAYINSRHPEFTDAHFATILNDVSVNSNLDGRYRNNDDVFNRKDETMEVATKNIPTNRSISPSRRKNKLSSHVSNFSGFGFRKNSDTVQMAPVNEMGASNGEDQMNNVQKNGGPSAKPSKLGGWFWSSTSSTDGSNSMGQASSETVQQQHERALNALERQYNVTAKEKRDCMVIERLIRSYFLIVRKSIQDMVPKSIMKFLVNHVRDNLQSELVRQLYNSPDIDELLKESDLMAQRRKEAAEMLEALTKANSVINEIRETHFW
ncbi:dynamin central region domain-containing protein [Ditylenchus destructor]|uniref:dynamin GTPase n=1 Tax=Ditylenchus destructor TaxID=166010 RepID=A0AAD4R5C2_9BILA|nr:dynamin central region domain-containing protein [Ditylenchus destructor]